MKLSGAQYPGPVAVMHDASCEACEAGTSDEGTQCAPAQVGLHCANEVGSMIGGPS
jgi:hypothetical protein